VGVATGFQWFQAFQVRNMAINRGALERLTHDSDQYISNYALEALQEID